MRRIEIEENPVELADVQNAVRLMLKNAKLRWICYALGILLVTLSCLYFWYVSDNNLWGAGFIVSLLLLALFCYRPFIYLPYVYPRKYHAGVAGLGKLTTVIDDNGILEKAENLQAFHNWDAVVKHLEDQNGIVILFVSQNFKYIPKRVLDAEQERELMEKLKQFLTAKD
jgi:hypothetical protein